MTQMLDPQQTAAVTTKSWRAMVIASAGSGKTRVITERIAYLIEERKVSPSEILCASFTRKASNEMRERLELRIGNKAFGLVLGTMHALALKMINRFGEIIGLKSRKVTIYSAWEEDFLLREVATEMGVLKGKTWKISKKDVYAAFGAYYSKGVEPAEDNPVYGLFKGFIQRCKENNALTYGGLMIGLKLLIPTISEYQNIKHILVDEVQDTDHLQWDIILMMEALFGASLFIVGDDSQAIYEWRGAAPEYMVQHQDEFDIFRLENNYRSVPDIVHASNRLIEHNVDRIKKTMVPTREDIMPGPAVGTLDDMDSERIADMTPLFTCPVAILGRNHFLLEKLSRILDERKVKHEYIGRTTALTNSEPFRRFHAFLKLAVNPYDNFSFLLIKDIIGLPQDKYSAIRVNAAEAGISHLQQFSRQESYDEFPFPVSKPLAEYLAFINERYPSLSPESLAFIQNWEGAKDTPESVEEYLNFLALWDVQDEVKKEAKEGLTLMTIHAAKGLEWQVVILAGLNEGILPSKQSIDADDISAERRLFYVAMTRARDQLILTSRPELEEKNERVYESPKSRFVNEALFPGHRTDAEAGRLFARRLMRAEQEILKRAEEEMGEHMTISSFGEEAL